uniref:NADH-ubiquinone oxidoreductase chain 4 n=1 Tax=Tipula cockerelliana TaxID=1807362 RepID=A0A191F7V9_9DIPT|nr:NADH dehydrogenase subunit 4 [Tipula cockerelliana]AMN09076.1 NADH dehydrogenase subunit 4 [Tipula cockerelliana]
MLKILFMLLFMIPLCFLKNLYWMVQNLLFLVSFIFIFMNFYSNNWGSISYFMGCDILSYGLILLSVWVCVLMLMASEGIYRKKNYWNFFLLIVLFSLIFLYLTFSTMNLFLFYLFFESSLIPTLFLIMGWGYQPERLQAGVYLLFYTLFASLPLLVGVFYIYSEMMQLEFMMLSKDIFSVMLYLSLIFAFLVKMPMFLVHLWLPKAHVEAPVSGSMILAGVLLKLGGYGILRVMPLIQEVNNTFSWYWVSISLVGGVLVSFICLRQTDLKSLIAYSSVAHMSIVLSGALTMTSWGMSGAYVLMIAHGLCSSGLFCLANISYERMGSRSLFINKGMLNFMPSMALWWFLLSSCNMAAPPSLNLLGEISLLNSIVSWSWISMFMLALLSFFSAAYTLYLYSYSQRWLVMFWSLFFYSGIKSSMFIVNITLISFKFINFKKSCLYVMN